MYTEAVVAIFEREKNDNNIYVMFIAAKVTHLMSVPTVLINSIATVITATAMGYYSATLEPHIRGVSYNISETVVTPCALWRQKNRFQNACCKKKKTKKTRYIGFANELKTIGFDTESK